MKVRCAILSAIVLFFSTAAFSQMFEVYGEYSYLRFNPTLSGLNNRSFNGAGGGATFYFAKFLGIKGEVMGCGSTTWTTTFPSSVITPGGAIIPAGTKF